MLTCQRTRRLLESAPTKFFEDTLGLVFDAYAWAFQQCLEFEFPEDYNLRPIMRRQFLERGWRKIAERYVDEGIVASYTRINGFFYHSRLVCNKQVILTHSPVRQSQGMVRPCEYRSGYAGPENQRWLFPECAEDIGPLLYAIVIYGRSENSWKCPGFAHVRFPNARLTDYYPGGLDLFAEFPHLVREKLAAVSQIQSMTGEELPLEPELIDDLEIPASLEL